MRGVTYLKRKLMKYQPQASRRYRYYDMKDQEALHGIVIPPEMQDRYRACIGWCSKAVDALADRLVFREFAEDNFELNTIFMLNSPDVFFR